GEGPDCRPATARNAPDCLPQRADLLRPVDSGNAVPAVPRRAGAWRFSRPGQGRNVAGADPLAVRSGGTAREHLPPPLSPSHVNPPNAAEQKAQEFRVKVADYAV